MIATRRPFSRLSNAWLVSTGSVVALVLLGVLLWSPWNRAGISAERPLLFYCAEGMTRPVAEIVKTYEKEYGVKVQVTYDGSGKLLSTMTVARGKGDLYMAADSSHMLKAQAKGKDGNVLVRESIPVAVIHPVLVVSKKTQSALKNKVRGLDDLRRPDLKVVFANPELASIGYVARQVLEPLGIWEALEKERKNPLSARVSHVGTVNQVALHVHETLNSVGIVWDAIALQNAELAIIPVPELAKFTDHNWIGVLSKSEQLTAALQFARYLTARDKGLEVLKKHKFVPVPDADSWQERPEIVLSAGAMLKPGVEQAIKTFEKREGARVLTNFAGCGLLVSQMEAIQKGAKGPFPDAYFACDDSFMDSVMPWFDPKSRTLLTRNDIVLIVPKENKKKIESLADLKRADLRKIGLAHPTKSALGKLTVDLLEKSGFSQKDYDPRSNERIVHADAGHLLVNQIRSLDAAIVYRSNAQSALKNDPDACTIIDLADGKELARQPFAIARSSQHKYLVKRLLQTITSAESAEQFRQAGFRWVYKED